jgi:hypothetical protein
MTPHHPRDVRPRTPWRTAAAAVTLAVAACQGAQTAGDAAAPQVAASTPTVTRDLLRAQLLQAAQSRGLLEERIGALHPQLSPRKKELLVEQTVWMFESPAFADRLHERIAHAVADDSGVGEVREKAAALGALLSVRGVARLGTEDQARFMAKSLAFLRHLDATACHAALSGTLNPDRASQLEMAFNASRSDAEYEADLALHGRALRAELQTSAPRPKLAPTEEMAAETAMQRAFAELRRIPANRAAFGRFDAAAPGRESAGDACWFGLQYIDTMLNDIRGEARAWQLQRYLNGLAGE